MCNECKIFTEKGKYYCPESLTAFKYCPFCGEVLKFEEKKIVNLEEITKFFDYVNTLEDGTDKWREAFIIMDKYLRDNKDPDEYIQEIIKKVEKKFKTK